MVEVNMEKDPILTFSQVSFAYQNNENILENLSFTIYRGEQVLLIGENGTGKTTLLKLLTFQLNPSSGTIKLGKSLGSSSLPLKEIAYVPQIQQVAQIAVSVIESVLLGLWGKRFSYMKRSNQKDKEEAMRCLELVGMKDFANRDLRTLSGGQRQKVAIARAIIRNPSLLLLDEPTTYLDKDSKTEMLSLINSISSTYGWTTLLISHDSLSYDTFDRLFILESYQLKERILR
jgi:ABC-type Mn2+/Zn2+ transport system ATPase subunit